MSAQSKVDKIIEAKGVEKADVDRLISLYAESPTDCYHLDRLLEAIRTGLVKYV